MRNKKVLSAICLFLALLMALTIVFSVLGPSLAAYAVSQSQIDALEDQKDALKSQRDEMQTQIDALKDQQGDVLDQKAALDEQNELNRQEIELIEEQISLYGQLVEEKAQALETARAAEQEQLEKYRTRVRAMEENGSYTYLEILFKCRSLSDLLTAVDEIGEIMDSDKRLYDQYTAARENTETVKAEYEQTLSELQGKQTELTAQKAELADKIEEATALITSLQSNIDGYTALYEENAAKEAEISSQITSMTAELKAQEEAARKAAEQANQTYTGVGSNATGTFMWPSASSTYITSVYGWRMHPIYHTERFHSGVDIGASAGTDVLAADSGTVSIATYSSSYGNYVVIYHSSSLSTLYAHMSSLAVSAGDTVSKGQTIGYVGSTGNSTGPHLHFEIRVNGSTVDPLSYFSNYTLAPDA